jgi:hypothetical protein
MNSWKFLIILVVGYAVAFFLISLRETGNLKDAFYEWIKAMLEWRDHAIPGLIFILVLCLLGWLIGEGNVRPQ